MFNRLPSESDNSASTSDVDGWLSRLRQKWGEIPETRMERAQSGDLKILPDDELLRRWQVSYDDCTVGHGFYMRGWYYLLYTNFMKGKRILDVGAGFGHDAITFARAGAHVTALDIVRANSETLQRLCHLMEVKTVETFVMDTLQSLTDLPDDFDVIWCCGSMITLPFNEARQEAQALLKHLKPGGRWIELGYPQERWIREGKMPFSNWGDKTDGGAPWMEWYDAPKLLARLEPTQFDTVLSFNFHNDDFNWFDLRQQP